MHKGEVAGKSVQVVNHVSGNRLLFHVGCGRNEVKVKVHEHNIL